MESPSADPDARVRRALTARRGHVLGALALAIYLLHAGNHVLRGSTPDLLWVCNLATALLAIGCLARRPTPAAIALLWLGVGTPLWLLDAVTGGEMVVTGILTHIGGTALAVLAVSGLGMPRGTWYRAIAAAAAVVALSRIATARAHNVNLAFSVRQGWEPYFASHLLYLAMLFAIAAVAFFAIERAFMRIAGEAR